MAHERPDPDPSLDDSGRTWQWTPHSDLPAATESPDATMNIALTLVVITEVLNCLPNAMELRERVEAKADATRLVREIEAARHAGMNWRQALANLRWLLRRGMPSAKVDANKLLALGAGVAVQEGEGG